jgi:hypothetical protein
VLAEGDTVRDLRTRIGRWVPAEGDAILYGGSAVFALATLRFSSLTLYRQWAALAVGPYLVAALVAVVLARRRPGRPVTDPNGGTAVVGHTGATDARPADAPSAGGRAQRDRPFAVGRLWLFVFVLVGATLVPLSLEVAWRSEGNPSAHVQPEASVIEQAGHRIAHGKDPYQTVVGRHGQIIVKTPGLPTYENFFPYLPLMTVFGLPSSTKAPVQVTDARIFFSLVTLLLTAVALVLCRGPSEPRFRTLQVMTVLPTASLPLATGGDDMPVVAFLLLAMVLAQRRQPFASGIVLGIVSAMKFTAWPLAVLALFAARHKDGRRAPWWMAGGIVLVAGPVVLPFIVWGEHAFVQNVILFPLGIAGVSSPAASALPGHELVVAFPWLHRALPVTVALVGGTILAVYLVRRPPRTAAKVCAVSAWVMTVAVLFAPATRFGYLLYPINFFVWAYLFRRIDAWDPAKPDERTGAVAVAVTGSGGAPASGSAAPLAMRQESSDTWNSRTVKAVMSDDPVPVNVVGEMTAPISQ